MNQNLNSYRVGDWVYCEISPNLPYAIRKIDELIKTQNGNVEAKVVCAFRRRDVSSSLLSTLEKHQYYMLTQPPSSDTEDESVSASNFNNNSNDSQQTSSQQNNQQQQIQTDNEFNDLQKYQLKHRELFYSKYTEQIPVSIIRGKCTVYLFTPDIDVYSYYLNNEDTFYYQLTYDPNQKTLLADKGEIRVGAKYQAEVPKSLLQENMVYSQRSYDTIIWNPNECKLTEDDFKRYTVIVQSIGTYARALDYNNSLEPQEPNSLISAKNASRDITLYNAHKYLHDAKYNLSKALLNFIPNNGNGPVLCKDEIEDWTAIEMSLFEEGLEKYGKDFNQIRNELLHWKTLSSIVEYYYMWKTTDRYVQRKRQKEMQQHKLNQIYIPISQKPNPSSLSKSDQFRSCDSCNSTQSTSWYLAHIQQQDNIKIAQSQVLTYQHSLQSQIQQQHQQQAQQTQQAKLCSHCWIYWRKYGAFKNVGSKGESERPGPDKRQERINANKTQIYKCSIEDCGKEFKLRTQLAKHYSISHALLMRNTTTGPKPTVKDFSGFYLITTPLTRAARLLCLNVKHCARTPFKPIDFANLKTKWLQEPRNIRGILETKKFKKIFKQKTLGKILKTQDKSGEYLKLINTNSNQSYKPQQIKYPKPPIDEIQKFHQNLHNQSKKRNAENLSNEMNCSIPPVKRTLLNNTIPSQNQRNNFRNNMNYQQQQVRRNIPPNPSPVPFERYFPEKSSNKSQEGICFYFHATHNTRELREKMSLTGVNLANLRKLARSPFQTDSNTK